MCVFIHNTYIKFDHHNHDDYFGVTDVFLSSSVPLPGKECPAGMLECKREGCVDNRQVCDGSDDCGDGTDEENCGEKSDVFWITAENLL